MLIWATGRMRSVTCSVSTRPASLDICLKPFVLNFAYICYTIVLVTVEYVYDPAQPFNHAQLEQAITSILTVGNLQVLLDDRNFIGYLEGMLRVNPYNDEDAKQAVELMLDAWNNRLQAYAVKQSEKDENFRASRAQSNSGMTTSIPSEQTDNSPNPISPEQAATEFPGNSSATPGPTQVTPASAAPAVELPLPTIDESKFAYSAWLMHEHPQERLLAASQYIDRFQILNLTLSDDPALDSLARPEAFELLYKGGRLNIHAARRFLDSLRRQIEAEGRVWRGQGISPRTEPIEASKTSDAARPRASARGDDEEDFGVDSDWGDKVEEEDV